MAQHPSTSAPPLRLGQLVLYFLKLGTIGFGGPAALVGYMRKDLVDDSQYIDERTYNLSIALAQIMPGPLAAQTAIAIGYFQEGILGATLVGLAFIVPSFLMVLALSWLYVIFGGLPWMQALFYGIGAVVIAIIAMAAYRLARGTNKRDPVLWGIFGVLLVVTVWSQAELAALFILAGLVVMSLRAWPGWRAGLLLITAGALVILGIWGMETFLLRADTMASQDSVLGQILLFFTKAGAFVFGSGLAIVPFLEQGVVHDLGWLTDYQFLDAVAVAMITPGPVVITVEYVTLSALASLLIAATLLLPRREQGIVVRLCPEEHTMALVYRTSIALPAHHRPGGFDHAAVHHASAHLYVAHTVNDALDVIDCATDRYLHSIPNLVGVAGALLSDEHHLVFTSNRGENTVGIFAPDAKAALVKIPVGIGPNGLAYDPGRRLLLAANVGDPAQPGSTTVSLVDVGAHAVIAHMPVPGRTRWAVFDPHQEVFFVNIADPATMRRIETIETERGGHTLAFDAERNKVYAFLPQTHRAAVYGDKG